MMPDGPPTARYDKAFTWKARIIIVTMLGVGLTLSLLVYWGLQPADGLVYKTEEALFNADTHAIDPETGFPIVEQGQWLHFTFDYCTKGPSTLTLRWMDYYSPYGAWEAADLNGPGTLSFSQPSVISNGPEVGCTTADFPFPLPFYPRDGIYRYRFQTCYDVNPIKTSCETVRTEPFVLRGTEPEN